MKKKNLRLAFKKGLGSYLGTTISWTAGDGLFLTYFLATEQPP